MAETFNYTGRSRNWTVLGTPGPLDTDRLLLPLLREGSLQQNPWYQLQVQESVTVQEGLCVLVPCTVSYPSLGRTDSTPIYGEWFRKGDRPSQMDLPMATNNPGRGVKKKRKIPFHLLGDPGANNCSLGIADARKGDSGNYYFQLMRGDAKHSYKNNLLVVNVTGVPSGVWLLPLSSPALTRTPDIYVKEPLESGSSSHMTCSVPGACERATPPTISWTGAALRPPGLDSKGAYNSSEILLTPRPQDHGTNLTCRVTFRRAGVSTERTIMLNVSYAPQNLTISISRGNSTGRKGGPVKTFRKAPGEKDEPSMLGPTSQGYQHECPPGSPLDLLPPVVAAPTSGEEQELHYASLSFYALRPWEPQDQEAASTTKYAEIKIHK
ncbi:myeloid cell surface antigen CD33-like [Eubalaena glacialis]|uniref:myeloid cell surface antigen CD33-like n=1 Tax=Eubalaena glacialis TaxID=27606 RepID=UPI002A59F223|nr:myeloid cell surface antigen CD33-like [Eubalaena glacialis]